MEWADKEEALQALARTGANVPALERKPDISGYEWLWIAFVALDSCRGSGMGMGPIPWTATQQYAEAHRLGPFETEELHAVVRSLDQLRLKHGNK